MLEHLCSASNCTQSSPRHTDRRSTAAATALRIPALGVRRLVLAEVRALATLRAAAMACLLLDAYRHVGAPRRHSQGAEALRWRSSCHERGRSVAGLSAGTLAAAALRIPALGVRRLVLADPC